MTSRDVIGARTEAERLASIEQLLEQYRTTREPRVLRLAIELWDEMRLDKKRPKEKSLQIH